MRPGVTIFGLMLAASACVARPVTTVGGLTGDLTSEWQVFEDENAIRFTRGDDVVSIAELDSNSPSVATRGGTVQISLEDDAVRVSDIQVADIRSFRAVDQLAYELEQIARTSGERTAVLADAAGRVSLDCGDRMQADRLMLLVDVLNAASDAAFSDSRDDVRARTTARGELRDLTICWRLYGP